MITARRFVARVACLALTLAPALAWMPDAWADDDDDKPADAAQAASGLSLTVEQQQAVGIALAHPVAARVGEQFEGLGLVLDPESLVADSGDLAAADAAARATRTEVLRLTGLYENGAGASLKMLEAARAEEARALAQWRLAAARFTQRWAPLQRLPRARRERLLAAVASGRSLLLRAGVAGRHTLPAAPARAQLDVDGLKVSAQVLGVLRQSDATQSAGVLLGLARPPAGLGAGARVPVSLEMAERSGFLLPRDALLFDEVGAYVFKQLRAKPKEKLRYVRVNVKLLLPHGGQWLLQGVDDDDDIVVAGAGVLWSLEGLRGRVVDDDV
jgi:hypothetical protein